MIQINRPSLLLTGGLWYIWSHTAVALAEAWYEPIIVDSLVNADAWVVDRLEHIMGYRPTWYRGDLRDRAVLQEIFAQHTIEGVLHFAGLKAVGESCVQISAYHDANISSTLRLLEVMQEYNVKRLIFSSSATVYAGTNTMPLTEKSWVWDTTNPYGTTKLVIEQLLHDYGRHLGWSIALLRYFNPIGAHPSGLIGEQPRGRPNNLLPYIMQVAAGKRDKLGVFGNDYDTVDGTGVRDYIDVMDLAAWHLCAYEWLSSRPLHDVAITDGAGAVPINLGVGRGWSVMEMVTLVEEVTGCTIPYEILPRRTGDLPLVYSDPTYAHKLLWRQAKRSIMTSIATSWQFAREVYMS